MLTLSSCAQFPENVVLLEERECDMMSVGFAESSARLCIENPWSMQVMATCPDIFVATTGSGYLCREIL